MGRSSYFSRYFSAKTLEASSSAIPTAGIGLRVEIPPPAPPVSFQKSSPRAATLMPVIGNGTWSLTYCEDGTWLFTEEMRYMKSGFIPAALL